MAGLWVDYSSDWGIWDCGVLLVRLWRDGVLVGWASVAAARLVGWVGVVRLVRLVRRGCSGWAGAAGA
ncbi:hypothetical protein [uncultured Bifidobacterium sp.]|uniref:hypothetical protein n=1 Tax=uncultured Bifidobacterium sp. TaxID=165187 RepID=UPI0025F79503|nr:hypothetical protein [uncultured Bifidobacterium sp.]